ncbi:hypothetical protein RHMOL_Rhmol13G0288600 [Rhododendron molle]|uniref:Uncharacterized protein n=1 Tax=Rhododendron molle TaxID=49168 RepID=A0ACC0LD41_RHOML|nr:hypothetical protein RHMOL_Rhmol13G0288600 [Rhododendron molle]
MAPLFSLSITNVVHFSFSIRSFSPDNIDTSMYIYNNKNKKKSTSKLCLPTKKKLLMKQK